MDENLQKEIEERIAELPEDIQEAILAADLDARVQRIGAKHQLHVDQMGVLADETMLVMLGFVELEQFASQLETHLKISPEAARALGGDVSNEIFMPIRESMKKFTASNESASTPTQASQTMSPSSVPAALAPPQPPQKPVSQPQQSPEMHPADVVLTEKTLSVPPAPVPTKPAEPPNSNSYKMDPYREPIE